MRSKLGHYRIFSPDESSISNGGENVRACVIERTIFDRHLLQRVAEAGDNVMMKTKVVGLGLGLDPGPGLQSRPGNARGKKVVL
ncbi:MAG: hypothetical protein C5S45_00705 [Candidatus Methanocomedens sp.]|nr:MAG: hypothetical protein C5S45_00705 [ANME-2 cluster archaeon]